jgi:hypothetical protein
MKTVKNLVGTLLACVLIFSACEKSSTEIQDAQNNAVAQKSLTTALCFNQKFVDPDKSCGYGYEPVCACEVINFDNACEAKKAGFVNYTPGTCENDLCPNEEVRRVFMQANIICPVQFEVCGCDGITYQSYCKAIGAGNAYWTYGRCGFDPVYEIAKHM